MASTLRPLPFLHPIFTRTEPPKILSMSGADFLDYFLSQYPSTSNDGDFPVGQYLEPLQNSPQAQPHWFNGAESESVESSYYHTSSESSLASGWPPLKIQQPYLPEGPHLRSFRVDDSESQATLWVADLIDSSSPSSGQEENDFDSKWYVLFNNCCLIWTIPSSAVKFFNYKNDNLSDNPAEISTPIPGKTQLAPPSSSRHGKRRVSRSSSTTNTSSGVFGSSDSPPLAKKKSARNEGKSIRAATTVLKDEPKAKKLKGRETLHYSACAADEPVASGSGGNLGPTSSPVGPGLRHSSLPDSESATTSAWEPVNEYYSKRRTNSKDKSKKYQYRCNLSGCLKICYNVGNMNRHLETLNHQPRSVQCDRCSKFYTRVDALRRHRKTCMS